MTICEPVRESKPGSISIASTREGNPCPWILNASVPASAALKPLVSTLARLCDTVPCACSEARAPVIAT
ncbi:hypothetical protein D9M69_619530 [compost metagenome]